MIWTKMIRIHNATEWQGLDRLNKFNASFVLSKQSCVLFKGTILTKKFVKLSLSLVRN
jgi:hypothetical protein